VSDTCQSGACVGNAPSGCLQASATGRLVIKNDANDKRDRLIWKWSRGATDVADLGDPTNATAYRLCIFDQTAGVDHPVMRVDVPAGSAWRPIRSGFSYRDRFRLQDGVRRIRLRAGAAGKASVFVMADGVNLPASPLPLQQDTTVTVQLGNGTSCWEAKYSTYRRSDAGQFRAKSD
jgi:hypothetical protein